MWYYQSNAIVMAQNVLLNKERTFIDANHSLKLVNVQPAYQGTYECRVLPNNTTLKVNLVIKTKPIATIYDMGNKDISGRSMTYSQGNSVEIICKGVGQPKPTIKWFANGERVGGSHGIHVSDGTLIIKHADHQHVRLYQCLADNEMGVGHATININVKCKSSSLFICILYNSEFSS